MSDVRQIFSRVNGSPVVYQDDLSCLLYMNKAVEALNSAARLIGVENDSDPKLVESVHTITRHLKGLIDTLEKQSVEGVEAKKEKSQAATETLTKLDEQTEEIISQVHDKVQKPLSKVQRLMRAVSKKLVERSRYIDQTMQLKDTAEKVAQRMIERGYRMESGRLLREDHEPEAYSYNIAFAIYEECGDILAADPYFKAEMETADPKTDRPDSPRMMRCFHVLTEKSRDAEPLPDVVIEAEPEEPVRTEESELTAEGPKLQPSEYSITKFSITEDEQFAAFLFHKASYRSDGERFLYGDKEMSSEDAIKSFRNSGFILCYEPDDKAVKRFLHEMTEQERQVNSDPKTAVAVRKTFVVGELDLK